MLLIDDIWKYPRLPSPHHLPRKLPTLPTLPINIVSELLFVWFFGFFFGGGGGQGWAVGGLNSKFKSYQPLKIFISCKDGSKKDYTGEICWVLLSTYEKMLPKACKISLSVDNKYPYTLFVYNTISDQHLVNLTREFVPHPLSFSLSISTFRRKSKSGRRHAWMNKDLPKKNSDRKGSIQRWKQDRVIQ